MVEVVGDEKTPLYSNCNNNRKDVIKFLTNNNFKIIRESKNDKKTNELNIRFCKNNLDFSLISEELLHIYKDNLMI